MGPIPQIRHNFDILGLGSADATQEQEFKALFDLVDKDKNGSLNQKVKIAKMCGVKMVDKDKNGSLNQKVGASQSLPLKDMVAKHLKRSHTASGLGVNH